MNKDQHITSFSILLPAKERIAYAVRDNGKTWIKEYDLATGKTKTIDNFDLKITEDDQGEYPILTYHPKFNFLVAFTVHKGLVNFILYDLETKEKSIKTIENLEIVSAASYRNNGQELVLSAVHNGQSDLYLYRIAGNNLQALTNDKYDDSNWFSLTMVSILFFSQIDQKICFLKRCRYFRMHSRTITCSSST